MTKKLFLLTTFYILLLSGTHAQTKKIAADPLLWADLQADYYLANQSFFFFKTQLRHNTNSDFAGINESGFLSNFYQVYFLLGYDQKLTDHWRAAASARYTVDAFNNNQIYQASLQHNGKIGETDFIKRLAYDYMKFEIGQGMGRIRPMAALERNFKIGNRILRPHLSYELFFYNDFNSEPTLIETRTVDRTRLRLALSYQVSKHFWLTPFFTKQTEYINVLTTYTVERDSNGNIVYDSDGNEVLIENKGGKRNRVEPIFGLELRFLLPGRNISENTIPNLGNLTETAN